MKAYEIAEFGRTGVLKLVDRPEPQPGPGEVLVQVRATGPNARDFAIMSGEQHGVAIPAHRIPLSDNAGDVLAAGPGVMEPRVGDRVTMSHYWRWLDGPWDASMRLDDFANTLDGFLVERRVVPAQALLRIPASISYEEASTYQSAGLTAWNAVVASGRARADETIVTLGTGGVSLFAMQWAKMLGARVIVTSSSDEKLARARELGADATVNYRTSPDWHQAVLDLTMGRGADLVVNTVGGGLEMDRCLEACASGGRICLVGSNGVAADRRVPEPQPIKRLGLMIIRDLTLRGIIVGSRKMLSDLMAAAETCKIKPVIDSVWSFDQADQAIAHARSAKNFGKVVIRVS